MMTNPLTRREFFRSLSIILLVPWSAGLPAEHQAHTFVDRLLGVCGHSPRAARAIGCAYLRSRPDEQDVVSITKKIIEQDPDLVNCLKSAHEARLERILKRRIAEDFSSGNTVQLNGWVLARTEVRLCALRGLV